MEDYERQESFERSRKRKYRRIYRKGLKVRGKRQWEGIN